MGWVSDSDEFRPADGVASWNEVIGAAYVPLDVALARRDKFCGRVVTPSRVASPPRLLAPNQSDEPEPDG